MKTTATIICTNETNEEVFRDVDCSLTTGIAHGLPFWEVSLDGLDEHIRHRLVISGNVRLHFEFRDGRKGEGHLEKSGTGYVQGLGDLA